MSIAVNITQPLDDFSLQVDLALPKKGISAIYGVSGSGKTTLLNCLAGLIRAEHAQIAVDGTVWQDTHQGLFLPVHRRGIGFVFQQSSLFEHLNVEQNIMYGAKRRGFARYATEVKEAITLLGIEALLGRRCASLSGGEKQRVVIARALASAPKLLLMDEPLAALDDQRKQEILPYLEQLHHRLQLPIVYVSHSRDEVSRLADHLVLLERGRVLASGPCMDMFSRLDLPLSQAPNAGVVLTTCVSHYDSQYALAQLAFNQQYFSVVTEKVNVGQQVRLQIQAKDVSVCLAKPSQSSILNSFEAHITEISVIPGAQVMLKLTLGQHTVLARITKKSADELKLETGLAVFAQVKSVALLI
jgi:molybdate transport system ATP-binding protein